LDYQLFILNRWGNVVFETSKNGLAFTGKDINNNDLLPGVYFYRILSEGYEAHGHITIIR
jgi:hypothetical protein